ncbi:hypothetical protein EJ110_NYTH56900 [Nymphaea thermarum]|nr:hypothetical protein EJ110_NYTH56900 [Nymphaea thermarum]
MALIFPIREIRSFVNTEMYARVSVAVLFYKLANLAEESEGEGANKEIVICSGKMFLLQLLDAAHPLMVTRGETYCPIILPRARSGRPARPNNIARPGTWSGRAGCRPGPVSGLDTNN